LVNFRLKRLASTSAGCGCDSAARRCLASSLNDVPLDPLSFIEPSKFALAGRSRFPVLINEVVTDAGRVAAPGVPHPHALGGESRLKVEPRVRGLMRPVDARL
jgi:hypothetical protein